MRDRDRIKQVVEEIKNEPLMKKYLYNHTWVSGSSTTVYPVMIWNNDVDFQLSTHNNYFKKFIERICNKYSDVISKGYFNKLDGSCPSVLCFRFK